MGVWEWVTSLHTSLMCHLNNLCGYAYISRCLCAYGFMTPCLVSMLVASGGFWETKTSNSSICSAEWQALIRKHIRTCVARFVRLWWSRQNWACRRANYQLCFLDYLPSSLSAVDKRKKAENCFLRIQSCTPTPLFPQQLHTGIILFDLFFIALTRTK